MTKKVTKDTKTVMDLQTGPGHSDVYSPITVNKNGHLVKNSQARTREWTVNWQSLILGVSQSGPEDGTMKNVQAEVYVGNNGGSTIVADTGEGSKENKQLVLNGNVVVTSKDGKSTLKCDRLRYVAGTHRFYAAGNVRFQNAVASNGTFSQLIASSDLRKVATPEDFHQ